MSEPSDSSRVGELLLRCAHTVRKTTAEDLEPLGLSPHHARALEVIARGGAARGEPPIDVPPRLSLLADRLRIAPRSVTEVVDALEDKGLVRREPDPSDRRATVVQLTDEGEHTAARIRQLRHSRMDRLLDTLEPAEQAQLTVLLQKVLNGTERPRGMSR
ncbi:DNA-binding MarR family transcriptional regulator [Branchiibius hedensis]|uniref:DNA-binding transcriptional regulator, MarR family n=1 Tax=Branchiibius hedensis TaxID=672460 RepID=A0A2Y8ZRP7_9MICO|nr:MarR family transcriptional regulator [Branchiibius hedensis]PWJ25752.1 DNA-binding MarR family transcriptional regulator [Branchiibius hedensis]SSA34565.1 DNA-binding transcriptional regulator, MarR family [Branchiibius hedensis]